MTVRMKRISKNAKMTELIPSKESVAGGIGLEFFKAVKGWQETFLCPRCKEKKLDISKASGHHPIICRGCGAQFDLKLSRIELLKSFIDEWRYFCGRVNFGKSPMDARAITFMNEFEKRLTEMFGE